MDSMHQRITQLQRQISKHDERLEALVGEILDAMIKSYKLGLTTLLQRKISQKKVLARWLTFCVRAIEVARAKACAFRQNENESSQTNGSSGEETSEEVGCGQIKVALESPHQQGPEPMQGTPQGGSMQIDHEIHETNSSTDECDGSGLVPVPLLTLDEAILTMLLIQNNPVAVNHVADGAASTAEPGFLEKSTQHIGSLCHHYQTLPAGSDTSAAFSITAQDKSISRGNNGNDSDGSRPPEDAKNDENEVQSKARAIIYWPREWRDNDPSQLGWYIRASDISGTRAKKRPKKRPIQDSVSKVVTFKNDAPILTNRDEDRHSSQSIKRWIHSEETLAQMLGGLITRRDTAAITVDTPSVDHIQADEDNSKSFEEVKGNRQRWRRKGKPFEEKAKRFVEARSPLPTWKFYEVLVGLMPNEDDAKDDADEADVIVVSTSKKWKKKRSIFQEKAQQYLDDDGALCISNSFSALSSGFLSSDDDDTSDV